MIGVVQIEDCNAIVLDLLPHYMMVTTTCVVGELNNSGYLLVLQTMSKGRLYVFKEKIPMLFIQLSKCVTTTASAQKA